MKKHVVVNVSRKGKPVFTISVSANGTDLKDEWHTKVFPDAKFPSEVLEFITTRTKQILIRSSDISDWEVIGVLERSHLKKQDIFTRYSEEFEAHGCGIPCILTKGTYDYIEDPERIKATLMETKMLAVLA